MEADAGTSKLLRHAFLHFRVEKMDHHGQDSHSLPIQGVFRLYVQSYMDQP